MNTTHTYGWIQDKPDQRDYQFQVATPINLPPLVDLRDKMPAVYDQGQLGSCTANSIAAALDFDRQKQGEAFINPSRLFIYYNERVDGHTVRQDSGATIRESIKTITKKGACPESEWPYDVSKFAKKPPVACFADALKYEGLTYKRVNQSVADIKTALASGLPVAIGISVYESFETDAVAKDGIVPMPASAESVLGGHAVLVCGYTTLNNSPYWIVRNSWGDTWGDKGYFYLPQAYLLDSNLSGDFWVLETVK